MLIDAQAQLAADILSNHTQIYLNTTDITKPKHFTFLLMLSKTKEGAACNSLF